MEDDFNPHDLPETTAIEIINKIEAMAWESGECRTIVRLTEKLKEFL